MFLHITVVNSFLFYCEISNFLIYLFSHQWTIKVFQYFCIISHVAKDMPQEISWFTCRRISLGVIPRNKIAGSKSICVLDFTRQCQVLFSKMILPNVHSHQQGTSIPIDPCTHQYTMLSVFIMYCCLCTLKIVHCFIM